MKVSADDASTDRFVFDQLLHVSWGHGPDLVNRNARENGRSVCRRLSRIVSFRLKLIELGVRLDDGRSTLSTTTRIGLGCRSERRSISVENRLKLAGLGVGTILLSIGTRDELPFVGSLYRCELIASGNILPCSVRLLLLRYLVVSNIEFASLCCIERSLALLYLLLLDLRFKLVLLQFKPGLRVLLHQVLHVTLLVEGFRAIGVGDDVFKRQVLKRLASLHLLLGIGHLRLLKLLLCLLLPLIDEFLSALLGRLNAAKESARQRLEWRRSGGAIGRKARKPSLEQAARRKLILVVVAESGLVTGEKILPCH